MNAQTKPTPLTFAYKRVEDAELSIDVYLPPATSSADAPAVPALVYYHRGGLCMGNKTASYIPWIQKRVNSAGCVFIAAEHRLLTRSTGHDVLADIRDLFRYLAKDMNAKLQSQQAGYEIDPQAIAVGGCSSGGLCAYLAAMHAVPKPKAVLAMYAQGNILSPSWISPQKVFFQGREMSFDLARLSEWIYPASRLLPIGIPTNPRMQLAFLYKSQGTWVDYYTGDHEPSLGAALHTASAGYPDVSSAALAVALAPVVPEEHRLLFPELGVTDAWPATFLVHGNADTAVPLQESSHMYALLQGAGVDSTLRVVEGKEHCFDYDADAEEHYGVLFDEAVQFVLKRLGKA